MDDVRSVVREGPGDDVLDHAAWASLTGAHAHLGLGEGRVRRYRPSVSPFWAVEDLSDPRTWDELASCAGAGETVLLTNLWVDPPPGWRVDEALEGVQMIGTDALRDVDDPEVVRLGADDVDDMLALVSRTPPGPFERETCLMGTYLGVRQGGELVAMAGERMHPPGWTEISAVCTDPRARGQGLATRLVSAVAHGIRARGEQPFLHAIATNEPAIGLYARMGFELRRTVTFAALSRIDA